MRYRRSVTTLSEDERRPIEERVKLLLRAAEVKGPPTPKESIVACAKMVRAGEIDLDDFRESLLERGLRRLLERVDVAQLWRKVKGFFRYDDRVFYVDPTQHRHQQTHHTYHEAYHAIDPAHKEMSDLIHLDTEETLAPWAKSKMEREANLGASLIRFQVDQLKKDSRDFPVGMETVCHLAERFDASIHATLRRYVEDYDGPCIMVVFNARPSLTNAGEPYYSLRYYLPSSGYEQRFYVTWPSNMCLDHWLFRVVNEALPDKPSFHEIILTDASGNSVPCVAQGFHNTYDILVFIYPKPQKRPKTEVVFQVSNHAATSSPGLGVKSKMSPDQRPSRS